MQDWPISYPAQIVVYFIGLGLFLTLVFWALGGGTNWGDPPGSDCAE